MPTIDEFTAKQEELLSTQQELRNTEKEIDNKTNDLKKAQEKNEDEKSELIRQLLDEIKALQENAKFYEQQIVSISAELATLRENTDGNRTQNNGEVVSSSLSSTTSTEQPVSTTSTEQPVSTTSTEQPVSTTTAEQLASTTAVEQPDIKLDSYEGYDKALSQLIYEIEGCAVTAKYKRGLNKSGKETLRTAKAKLKQYKDIISDKKRMLEHEFKEKNKLNEKNPDKVPLIVSISASEINGLKKRRGERRKTIEDDIRAGQRGESSNIAPWPNQSLEQVKKGNNIDRHHIEYDSKLNEALKDAAFLRIIDNNQDRAREFLQAIANNSLTDAQITICQSRMVQLSPYFEQYGLTDQVRRCIQTRGGTIEATQGSPRVSADYSNLDRGESFQQGGIIGLIDKGLSSCKNMTPGQRNTWKSVAVLGGYAAGIYGLFKFFTNKKMSFWSKALTTGGVILGSQMLTGENPITLFQRLLTGGFTKGYLESKFGNAFGDAVNGVGNSGIEVSNTITPAMYSLMIFNPSTTVRNVRDMTSRFENENEWKIFRSTVIEKLENKYGKNSAQYFSTNFPETFDKQKWTNRLASFGVIGSTDDTRLIYELANNASMNASVIQRFKEKYGLKETDNDVKKKEYNDYISGLKNNNQAIDIDFLEKQHKNDRFIPDYEATFTDRQEDLQNKEKLNNQVDQLSLDDQTKSDLKSEIQLFYDERPIKNKPNLNDFSLDMDNNLLVLESHNGEKTKIDLQNKTLKEFGSSGSNTYEIRFTRTKELLDTAYLTNDILARQKNKQVVNMPPFQYKQERKGICFNDAETLSFNFDTRILSTGRGGATSKIETLNNNPRPYAEYLSKCWIEENKVNINPTLYPTVKKLSESGIIFTNEQEVKNLEDWLKGIKENLKFSVATPNSNPFSITLTNKLEFKAVNGDTKNFPENISEKFPTLLRTGNKENFLKIMNNPDNKMRGSVHN